MKNLKIYESFGPDGNGMSAEERIELLQEAQEKLNEVIGLVQEGLKGTSHERHAEAYLLGHLRNWLDSGNRFDMGIQQYIDKIEEEGDEEEDEEFEF